MLLWRLSSERRARDFDGGYGIHNDGRWNTTAHPVTYCSTVPSLAALEKRVHVTDPALLPPQVMVAYETPDDLPRHTISIADLPSGWIAQQSHTQSLGDAWLETGAEALAFRAVRRPTDRARAGPQRADQSSRRGCRPDQDCRDHTVHARSAPVQAMSGRGPVALNSASPASHACARNEERRVMGL